MQQRSRLLLVDGDANRRSRLCNWLRGMDFEVRTAADGASGLLAVHEYRPAVVLATADAPILNGLLLLEAIRSTDSTHLTHVILLMPRNSGEELTRAWKAGADLCVPCTGGEADLFATLYRALGEARLRSESRFSAAVAV